MQNRMLMLMLPLHAVPFRVSACEGCSAEGSAAHWEAVHGSSERWAHLTKGTEGDFCGIIKGNMTMTNLLNSLILSIQIEIL